MEGWIKTYRSLITHWIWKDSEYLKAWIYLLFRANFSDTNVLVDKMLLSVTKGQFITSLKKLSDDTGMSIQRTRTFLKLLETDQMVKLETTSKLTKITICNYENYQDLQHTANILPTQCQHTANILPTTDKNVKKEKNENNEEMLAQKCASFKKSLEPFLEKYGRDMLNEFYLYWTEPTKGNTKLKFELQKTWDVERRLLRWANNDFNKSNQNQTTPKNPKIVTQTGYNGFKFD